MKHNPVIHALGAVLYISFIVFMIDTFESMEAIEGTLLMPIVMLCLFVFSAAVMGYLFIFQPFRLYNDGRTQEALSFFAQTLGVFAVCIAILITIVLVS